MDRLRARLLGRFEHLRDIEIALRRSRRTEQHRVVRLFHERQVRVGLGVDRYRFETHTLHRADHPPRNLPTIRDEYRLKRRAGHHDRLRSPTSFQAAGSRAPAISAFSRSPRMNGATPFAIAVVYDQWN